MLHCAPSDLKCLRNVSVASILSNQTAVPNFSVSPAVDGFLLQDRIYASLQNGKMITSLQSVILGTNGQEASIFILYPPNLRNLSKDSVLSKMTAIFGPQFAQKAWDRYLPIVT